MKVTRKGAGYVLARGDRGYVLVDAQAGVYSLARQLGMTLADVNEYMAPVGRDDLPTVDVAKARQKSIHPSQRKEPA